MRSPGLMRHLSPSTVVNAPRPWITKRIAGKEVLEAGPQGVRRAVAVGQSRVDEAQHPPLGPAVDWGELAAPLAEG